jgi:hypothetical protein
VLDPRIVRINFTAAVVGDECGGDVREFDGEKVLRELGIQKFHDE